MWLRQNTASQEILLGTFLDSTNGNDQETGLTIANTDIKIWKEGATTEANKNSGGATHIASGRYYAVLDATDSNTLGKLEVNVHVAGALTVRREFMVVPANVYDSLILGTDTLNADVTQWLGTAAATPTTAGVPEVDVTHVSGAAEDIATETNVSTRMAEASINTTGGAIDTVTTLTNKTGFSLAATGLDAIVSTATGMVEIAKAVWDRIISKANHNIGQSAGKTLRQSGDLVQMAGAVSDASPLTTGFDTDLTEADDYWEDAVLIFVNGAANAGLGVPISTYSNTNGAITFDAPDDWPITPVNGDDFVIFANHVHPIAQIQSGLATEAKQDIIDGKVDAIKLDTAAILIDTNEIQGDWTNGGRLDVILDAILDDTSTSGVVLTGAERNAIADAMLDRDMSTGADSGSPTVRTVRQALRSSRNKVSISGGTMTVTKEDDSTVSWTASITTTAGDPISAIDPV